ncbi:MAG: ferritin-like domain-containing protein [Longimicrobiales bacterium]
MNKLNMLERIDPELLDRMTSRRGLFREGAGAARAVAASSIPLGLAGLAKRAFAQASGLPQEIVDALNFALTLEYLEDEFYQMGNAASGLIPAGDQVVFQQIGAHETAHVAFLESVLGDDAVAEPTFDFTAGGMFPDVFTNYQTFLALSQGFEDTGVRAYKGQAGVVKPNDVALSAALRIHSVEARHAAQVRRMRGRKGWIVEERNDVPALQPVYEGENDTIFLGINAAVGTGSVPVSATTAAFDSPLTVEQVLAIADPFIVG